MTTTTTVGLLDALRSHLSTFDLPELSTVHLAGSLRAPQITAQITNRDTTSAARTLLAWAHTLTEPTAEIWRTPTGDSVHLAVLGQLCDIGARVYGAVPHTPHGPGCDLHPDTTTPLSLAVLRAWATLPEVPTR